MMGRAAILPEDDMGWPTLRYTKNQVDKAWSEFISPDDVFNPAFTSYEALEIINNWRSSHSFPLNTFTVGLKRRAKESDQDALVAQRIKRLSSIAAKLRRFPTMQLSQMQDMCAGQSCLRLTKLKSLSMRIKKRHKTQTR
jgi:hypothetical protein